jgi:subtilisin family serine protease
LKRVFVFAALAAALVSAATASAAFQPIRRSFGEIEIPRVRAGTIVAPAAKKKGRVTVIVTLKQPPLAAWHRTLAGRAGRARLNVASGSSRAYVRTLAAAQSAAVRQLQTAVPQATVTRRYRVLLNGFAVQVPASALPRVARLSAAARVYSSYRYSLALDRSPALLGATALRGSGLGDGAGVKIAVVDDGVDPTNPFFNSAGFSYPPGFPKGGTKWTTPKVIVARAFVGQVKDANSHLAVDRKSSFHGTHVAGIAAGDAGTTATAGPDHPLTAGLSGVAPRAWIGNYRVFNAPTPIGHVANTPEIVAAFESAVKDGMDVINFSGGGPETDPANDALIEAVRNVANAGVVAAISAGNDRDDYGLGSAGSPGTAPDAISVAAVSNTHVYAPALDVVAAGAPVSLRGIPFAGTLGQKAPVAWGQSDQTLVDVGSIVGSDGAPVGRTLCGPPSDPNGGRSRLPAGSLSGAIALVRRGTCTFVSKVGRARAAGATGVIFVDNRPGEANVVPAQLPVPSGTVADVDGDRLQAYLAGSGGRTLIRVGRTPLELMTGRGGVVTSFSSGGLTAFGHRLKPDLAAPGGQILSSTLPEQGGPFAVFDGTSMAAPHIAGAAAVLLQRHPGWSPRQVKSALMSTAGPAWMDTARTKEAAVPLAGGGLANVEAADDPLVFTDPASLSFGDVDVSAGAVSRPLLVTVSDAGDGAGVWTLEVQPQSQPAGVTLETPAAVSLAPGGDVQVPIVVRAAAGASAGDAYGFVLLRHGAATRRVPYAFLVTRPALASAPVVTLRRVQSGDTRRGTNRTSTYRYPAAPFGPAPDYVGPPVQEDGAETLYVTRVNQPVANIGAAIIAQSPNALVHPWLLGSQDENDVQGYTGTPVNVNQLTLDYSLDIGAAGALFPRQGRYFVAVDSGRDIFTGRRQAGQYVLWSWQNDVLPPILQLLTRDVAAGRPTIALRAVDLGSSIVDPGAGVDPLSLVISYRNVLIGASAYDPVSGIAIFALPGQAPRLLAGKRRLLASAADYQESKNVSTTGADIAPNTSVAQGTLRVVRRPTATWLLPEAGLCVDRPSSQLVVLAGSTAAVRSVRFTDGTKTVATARRGAAGLYSVTWRTRGLKAGRHVLHAVVRDGAGRAFEARRTVRVCRRG